MTNHNDTCWPRCRDHHFTPEQKEQYDSLRAQGRTFYDEARWSGTDHDTAFRDARYSYGLKKVV